MAKYIVHGFLRIAIDFTPETFGRLTTIGPKFMLHRGNVGKSTAMQVCQCSCDASTVVVAAYNDLRKGHTKSCGCVQIESARQASTRHGKRHTTEYEIWKGIKQRCTNPNNKSAHNYVNIGITMSI
jgi:hypothetical protein